jgi:hypothetical protein
MQCAEWLFDMMAQWTGQAGESLIFRLRGLPLNTECAGMNCAMWE